MLCLVSAGSVNFYRLTPVSKPVIYRVPAFKSQIVIFLFSIFKMLSSIEYQIIDYYSTIIFSRCSISAEIAECRRFKITSHQIFLPCTLLHGVSDYKLWHNIFLNSLRFLLRLPTRTLHTASFFARQLQDENTMTPMTQLKLLMNS